MQLTVRIEGADQIRVGLNRFLGMVEPITKAKIRAMMKRAVKRSVPYLGGTSYNVPERGYKRTGELGKSTFITEIGLSFRIESNAVNRGKEYSSLVIGRADGGGQASVHDGWWVTMKDAVDYEIRPLEAEIDDGLERGMEAAGL